MELNLEKVCKVFKSEACSRKKFLPRKNWFIKNAIKALNKIPACL